MALFIVISTCRLRFIAALCRPGQRHNFTTSTSRAITDPFRFDRCKSNKFPRKIIRINSHHSRGTSLFVFVRLPRHSFVRRLGSFVVKNNWRFKFAEARQRFRLTPTEKRVAIFILAAVVLGLATKWYRDAQSSPYPATWKIEQASSVRTTKAKRVSPKPTRELSDR